MNQKEIKYQKSIIREELLEDLKKNPRLLPDNSRLTRRVLRIKDKERVNDPS